MDSTRSDSERNPSDWKAGDVTWVKQAGKDIKPTAEHPNTNLKRVDLLRAVLKARKGKK